MVAFQNRAFLENEEKTKHYKFSVIAERIWHQWTFSPMNRIH